MVKGHIIWLEHFVEVVGIQEVVGRSGSSFQYVTLETRLIN